MSRVFFTEELEGVATFWRLLRRDGTTLGFTSHDRALYFGGVNHRAAPGMVPSAIRRTAELTEDSAEVTGALSDSSIRTEDLRQNKFDGASIQIGVVGWDTLENTILFQGTLGNVSEEGGAFTAELKSAKAQLDTDFVPRTSPTCRAQFCGPGCNLSAPKYVSEAQLAAFDADQNTVRFEGLAMADYLGGELRWIDGPQSSIRFDIVDISGDDFVLGSPLSEDLVPGHRAEVKQGCNHTISQCHQRFRNAKNFQGEPFLPGNDLLARYPLPQ